LLLGKRCRKQNLFLILSLLKKSPLHLATEERNVTGWEWKKHELIVEVAEQGKQITKNHLDLPSLSKQNH
jgi:hypothetical protein